MSNSLSRAAKGLVGSTPTTGPGPTDPRLEEEIDFSPYVRFLVRYWIPVLVCAVAGGAVGFVVAERRPTVYEAATTMLAHQGGSSVNVAKVRALVQNGNLAAQAVQDVGLDEAPLGLSPQAFVANAVRVDEISGTNFVRVVVSLPDPEKAAAASKTLAGRVVELNQQLTREESLAIRTHVKEQLDTAADRLNEAERQFLDYQNDAQVELFRRDTDSLLSQRDQLVRLLVEIEAEKSRLAAAEEEIRNHKPTLPLARSVTTEEALRRTLAADAPPAPVDAERLDLHDPFVNPIHQTLALQIAMSRIRLAGLERERQERAGVRRSGGDPPVRLADLQRRELQLARLQGTYDLAKQVHANLVVRYEQAPLEAFNRMMTLQVVDEAVRPNRPIPKKWKESAVMGFALGSLLALAGAIAWNAGSLTFGSATRV